MGALASAGAISASAQGKFEDAARLFAQVPVESLSARHDQQFTLKVALHPTDLGRITLNLAWFLPDVCGK